MKTKTIWYVLLVLLCCGAVLAVQQAATKPLPTKTTTTSVKAPAKTPVPSAPITAGSPAAPKAATPTLSPLPEADLSDIEVSSESAVAEKPAHEWTPTRPVQSLDQGGEDCASATAIASIPFAVVGTTAGYADNYDEVCPYGPHTSPDVVYSYVCTANMYVDISLCNDGPTDTDYDTKLFVYEDVCQVSGDGNPPYACNDDACQSPGYAVGPYNSEILGLALTSGHTYYIVVDGYGGESGNYYLTIDPGNPWDPDLPCPANSIFSQPPFNADEGWNLMVSDIRSGATSPIELIRFESYAVDEPICDIHWWGTTGYHNGTAWQICNEDPMTFSIKFYPDNAGLPGAAACTYTATVARQATGVMYGTWPLYYYSLVLDPCCFQLSGWLSIEGISDPNTCWFMWAAAGIGDSYSIYNYPSTSQWYSYTYDMAVCLTPGDEEIYGACCYPDWTCADNVLSTDCIALGGTFYANQLCADIPCDPPVECVVECPVGGTPESEICPNTTNDGCNMDVPAFEPIACDQTVCGQVWCDGSTRDTDWYQITLAAPTEVTLTFQGEFQAVAGFVDFPPCMDATTPGVCDLVTAIAPYVVLDSCVEGQVSACLPAGTWWLFVSAAEFYVIDCRDYYLTVTCAPCTVPVAACCYGDPSNPDCADLTECDCELLGGTWYEGELCATFECPEVQVCPPGTMYGQRPFAPDEVWSFTTSELNPGYIVYEDFYSVSGAISGVTFWGLNLWNNGSSWVACSENPMGFEIKFYPFDPTDPTMPDIANPVATYNVSLTGTPVDALFNGVYQEYRYETTFDPPVALNPGWMSIQGQGAEDCWFLWSGSPEGEIGSLQWTGSAYSVTGHMAYCFASAPCDPPAEATAYLIPGGVEVWFDAPGAGTYVVYSSTNPNNDGDPDGGADPDFTAEASIPVATAGAYNWIDAAYLANSYKNYVVVRTCPSFDPAEGRCCYGAQYQTCEDGVTLEYCEGLAGQWYHTLTCPCPAPAYCAAGATCDEYIMDFTVGTIANLGTACGTDGYTDYTALSTSMTIGTGYLCTIVLGTSYTDDACAVWVDWNGDLDWDDAGEEFLCTTSDFVTFTATITPPAGASIGNTRMRARVVWNETPLACGTRPWGETEDYTVNVAP